MCMRWDPRILTASFDGYDAEEHRARTVLEKRANSAPPLVQGGIGRTPKPGVVGSSPATPATNNRYEHRFHHLTAHFDGQSEHLDGTSSYSCRHLLTG